LFNLKIARQPSFGFSDPIAKKLLWGVFLVDEVLHNPELRKSTPE
jgi:hypothetical protein